MNCLNIFWKSVQSYPAVQSNPTLPVHPFALGRTNAPYQLNVIVERTNYPYPFFLGIINSPSKVMVLQEEITPRTTWSLKELTPRVTWS